MDCSSVVSEADLTTAFGAVSNYQKLPSSLLICRFAIDKGTPGAWEATVTVLGGPEEYARYASGSVPRYEINNIVGSGSSRSTASDDGILHSVLEVLTFLTSSGKQTVNLAVGTGSQEVDLAAKTLALAQLIDSKM
jgi:hypothetical protein